MYQKLQSSKFCKYILPIMYNQPNYYLFMIVLFLNLHGSSPHAKANFHRYYSSIIPILKQTIYLGNDYHEQVRDKDSLDDFIYDEVELNRQQRALEKFESVSYVFIDGPLNIPPWLPSMRKVFLLIRNCLQKKKKVHFNGYGHIASYYYLCTSFERPVNIKKIGSSNTGNEDFFYDGQSGELFASGKRFCSSGIKVLKSGNPFNCKSHQALKKGAIMIGTKFDRVAFNSKNGGKLIEKVKFPFTFFEKSKVYCVPVKETRANVKVLVETEDSMPIVFEYENTLSTHLLCPETSTIFSNWICQGEEVKVERQVKISTQKVNAVGFDNTLRSSSRKLKDNYTSIKTFSNLQTFTTHTKMRTLNSRPQTAQSKKKYDFEKPIVRCSGPYETLEHIDLTEEIKQKPKLMGRSRMNFKPEPESLEIKNYVQRTPSRPPSAHNFRETNKSKWMDQKTFFVT